jgi:hypothetical protein
MSERRLMIAKIDQFGTLSSFDWWESEDQGESQMFIEKKINTIHSQVQLSNDLIKICFLHSESMLLPQQYVEPNQVEQYLSLLFGTAPLTTIKSGTTYENGMMHAYRLESSLDQTLNTLFPHAEKEHVLRFYPVSSGQTEIIRLTIYQSEVRIHVQDHGKIQLHQVYTYQAKEDILYYLLSVCAQYHWNPSQTCIEISGLISKDSALHDLIYRSFGRIEFKDSEIMLPEDIDEQAYPLHLFTPILEYSL